MKKKTFFENFKSIFWALLIALSIRAFLLEPYKIPSESMYPTLLVGDYLFVNKFVYGLRIPFTKIRFWKGRDPERGEVVIFTEKSEPYRSMVKRAVGLPGDRLKIENNVIFINEEPVTFKKLSPKPDGSDSKYLEMGIKKPYEKITSFPSWESYNFYQETLGEKSHLLQQYILSYPTYYDEVVIPEEHYFVMGDNRDNSADSRSWGFLPRENLKGKAMFIWLSNDRFVLNFFVNKWHRFGQWIH